LIVFLPQREGVRRREGGRRSPRVGLYVCCGVSSLMPSSLLRPFIILLTIYKYTQLRYYLSHPEEAEKIAMQGYHTAITYHR